MAGLMEQVTVGKARRELIVTTRTRQAEADREYWRGQSPDVRLSEVENLRMEAGRFLYEYPARLRRVVAVTRRA